MTMDIITQAGDLIRDKRGASFSSRHGTFDRLQDIALQNAPTDGFDNQVDHEAILALLNEKQETQHSTHPELPRILQGLEEDIKVREAEIKVNRESSVIQEQSEIIMGSDPTRDASQESPQTDNDKMSSSESQEDVLDPGLRVMDPHRYFENLNNLRERVIRSSEFFLCRGWYKPPRTLPKVELTAKPSSVPAEIWKRCEALVNPGNPCSEISKSEKIQEDLALYMKTYLILSWIVDNLHILNGAKFCGDYYSLLLEHPDHDLAEIIRLPRKMISDFKESLEPVLLESSHETIDQLLKHTAEQCSTILALLGPINRPTSSTRSPGQLFWMTAALLDLALVSYVGSHGLHPGLGTIKGAQFGVEISDLFGFRCRSNRTGCLNDFFDRKQIWTFNVSKSAQKAKGNLSILGRIEEFADLWGPVWAETVSQEDHELIRWYTVSKGFICRVPNDGNTFRNAKRCHWYFEACFTQELRRSLKSKGECLHKDDLILIGSNLVENKNCTYSMEEFEEMHQITVRPLDTKPATWEVQSRTLTVSFSKVAGFQIQVSQKLVPVKIWKDSLCHMWEGLTRVEPLSLNLLLGVEVSHCTGNARRVSLKSLLLNKAIQPLLELWKPKWTTTEWGATFRKALCSSDPNAVSELWRTHTEYRSHIAEIVHHLLQYLHMTGVGDGDPKLRAAFPYLLQGMAVDLDTSGNEWAKSLCDSQTNAAYVLLNEICLECRTPNHPTSICGNSRGYTVLQMQVNFQERHDLSLVQLFPQDLVLARVNENAPQGENVLMTIASPLNRLLSRLSSSKVVGKEATRRLSQHKRTVGICVQASTKRFGGMEFCRRPT